MTVANCPSCGAAVEFAIGSSAVVVCSHCRSLVARTDRGVENLGKVAALIDTGSVFRVGATGKYRGVGYRITGRTQMRHEAGGIWNEWYAAFDDGRWGWLAEAQGRYYVTFQTAEADVPGYEALDVGAAVQELGGMVVQERGRAVLESAEGELPWRPLPNTAYLYADLSGAGRRFGTIDYSEERPLVFKGFEVNLDELGVAGDVTPSRVRAVALNCANCGGALNLVAPDQAERVYCPNCGGAHDVSEGKLRYLAQLKQDIQRRPLIPLGTRGNVDGDEYIVTGYMERSVTVEGIKYFWSEYLLFNRERGFRWLVHSENHWSFVTPIAAGDVVEAGGTLRYGGRRFREFQRGTATVEFVLGEFYWKVQTGERTRNADYIAPPESISKERTMGGADEVTYSHARYVTRRDISRAFGVRSHSPSGVGSMQPNPFRVPLLEWVVFFLLTALLGVYVFNTRAGREVVSQTYDLQSLPAGTPEGGDRTHVFFTDAFELTGRQNVAVRAYSVVLNSWIHVTGDLLNESTGVLQTFQMPIEYYEGRDSDGPWTEGSRTRQVFISAPPAGRYSMRFEVTWPSTYTPPDVQILVREGVFRFVHLLLALGAITIAPVLIGIMHSSFEGKRWQESSLEGKRP